MNPVLRNIIAFFAGWLGGGILNMALVQTGYVLFPVEGFDPADMETLAAAMPTLEFRYFIFPFLAHAMGTLAGAFLAAWIAATHKTTFAYVIGGFFLLGGIVACFMFPAPVWFMVADLLLAYIPMAWLGARLAGKVSGPRTV